MFKFAVLCGALVLSSASVYSQSSRDKSSNSQSKDQGRIDSRGRGSSSSAARPIDLGSRNTRSSGGQRPDIIRKDAPKVDRGRPTEGRVLSHPIERNDNRPRSTGGGRGGWASGSSTGGSPIDENRNRNDRPRGTQSRSGGGSLLGGTPIDENRNTNRDDRNTRSNPVRETPNRGGWGNIQNPTDRGRDQGRDKNRDQNGRTGGGSSEGRLIKKEAPYAGPPRGIDTRRDHHDRPDPIRRPPHRIPDLPERVRRSEHITINWGNDYYRSGYAYCNDWYSTPRWHYRSYCYEPSSLVVISPFYYYAELPPYLNVSSVTYGGYYADSSNWRPYSYNYAGSGGFRRSWDDDPFSSSGGRSYNYDDDRYSDRSKFDIALDNIVDAFAEGDAQFVRNLVPTSGSVAIAQDGYVRYSIGANDFENLYRDLIESTRSRGYQIQDVRIYDNDSATVTARHERIDPYGNLTTVYHQYKLNYEGRRFVIRKFGVSVQN